MFGVRDDLVIRTRKLKMRWSRHVNASEVETGNRTVKSAQITRTPNTKPDPREAFLGAELVE